MSRVLLVVSLLAATAQGQTISYFDLKGPASDLVVGVDGNLWFPYASGIGRMTPLGELATFPALTNSYAHIASSPDGKVWYTQERGFATIDVRTGARASYEVPWLGTTMAVTPDANLWFSVGHGIERLAPNGETVTFPAFAVLEITADPDGNIWFTSGSSTTPTSRMTRDGAVTSFSVLPFANPTANHIAAANDGTIWVTIQGARLAHLSADGQVLAVFKVQDYPMAMAVGRDNRVWLAMRRSIDVLSPDGAITSIAVPGVKDGFHAVAITPDGNVWAAITIGRICLSACADDYDPPVEPALVRINLVNPAPAITGVTHAHDELIVRGLGFVPDTVIRFDGIDYTTTYRTPFEVRLDAPEASHGGTLVAVNNAPGGGVSAPFLLAAETPMRRRAAH